MFVYRDACVYSICLCIGICVLGCLCIGMFVHRDVCVNRCLCIGMFVYIDVFV